MDRTTRVIRFHKTGGPEVLKGEELILPDLNGGGAAAVNSGLFAAYFALIELAGLQPNQYVVITAASSSMGIAAIQLAKTLGAKIVAVTRSEAKGRHLTTAGADHVVFAGVDDVQETVLEITGGDGVDVVYDGVGGPGLGERGGARKSFGRLIVYGYLVAMEDRTPVALGACFLLGLNLDTRYR